MSYGYGYDEGSWWNDDWDDKSQSSSSESYGTRSYYGKRWKGYKEKLLFWKKDKDGNVVFPEVDYWDNHIVKNKKSSRIEDCCGVQAEEVIPGFVGGDLYRLLYNENPQLTKPEDNSKECWFDELSSLPIYGLAMQTNNSKFWSKIATEAIIDAIMQELDETGQLGQKIKKGDDKESRKEMKKRISKSIKDALDGKGQSNSKSDQQQFTKNILERGIAGAQKKMSNTRSFLDELGINPEFLDQSCGEGEILDRLLSERGGLVDKFFFNAENAVEFLKSTSNFFNTALGKQKLYQDNFLHADNFSDIVNPELFEFPFEIPNINVMTSKKNVQIDIYIDVSGSMSSSLSALNKRNQSGLSIIDVVSIFAYKLYRKGIVHSVYTFDYDVQSIDPSQILFISPGGGTSFTNVIKHYLKEKNKGSKRIAFILTDGCADTDLYHRDAYWMFIEGGPGDQMKKVFPDTQMRIWNNGTIKKISEWSRI